MVEVSENGLKDEEVVLDLGLTIGGGSFKKQEKLISNGAAFVVDSRENEYQNTAPFLKSGSLPEPESAILDPQMKREMQALRRQEAKRKRVEKKSRPGKNEPQMEEQAPPASEKKRTDLNVVGVSEGGNSVNARNVSLSNGGPEHHPYPVQPGQYPYPPVQFVPNSSGFAYPCVVPHFGGGGFRPFQVTQGKNRCQLEQNGGLIETASLKVSPICSASTVSDHYSGASHDGGSSDTKSHSGYLNGSISKETKNKVDHTATSNSFESNSKLVQPKEEEAKLISPNEESSTPTPTPLKENKENKMEPPKDRAPNTGYTQKTTTTLPQMPYVSTTGNGPKGRTVHGFLYRYSKSEISIVCVCHGSTFSPAAFVQHAGGTDVSQPLRHITVNPSAF